MEQIIKPTFTTVSETDKQGSFVIEPLFPGYGSTLGNALRRVLLSSLEGAAVDYVQIDGVEHEFSSIPNVKEDVIQILLKLKTLRFKLHTDSAELTLDVKGPAVVTSANFAANADCEVINQDVVLASLEKDAHLVMRIGIKSGQGYEPVERKNERTKTVGVITTDSIFSPVLAAAYHVENTRVGQMTNYDRLLLDVQTDGSIVPSEAIKQAATILARQYQAIASLPDQEDEVAEQDDEEASAPTEELIVTNDSIEILHHLDPKTKIEDAGFSPRTARALTAAGYKTLSGLKRLSDIKIQSIKGLGSKGVEEVRIILSRVD